MLRHSSLWDQSVLFMLANAGLTVNMEQSSHACQKLSELYPYLSPLSRHTYSKLLLMIKFDC